MSRRVLRIILLSIAALLVVAIGAIAVVALTFDPNSFKPRIIAAVKSATGRDIAINGNIGLSFTPHPTIRVHDVALANPPGFSRPAMATVQLIELQLAPLPLLLHQRVEIIELVLRRPDILLETDAKGRTNWQFAAAPQSTRPSATAPEPTKSQNAPAPSGTEATQTPPADRSAPPRLAVQTVNVTDAAISVRDERTHQTETFAIAALSATSASLQSPVTVRLDAKLQDVPFHLSGETGSLSGLQQSGTPWPVRLTLTAGTARLTVDGTIGKPEQMRGVALHIDGSIPDAAPLAAAWPNASAPPLHDVRFSAQLTDAGTASAPGIAVHDLKLALPAGQITGELTVIGGAVPTATGRLQAERIDADALAGGPRTPDRAPPPGAARSPEAAPPSSPTPSSKGRLFPDTPLAIPRLDAVNADLTLNVGTLRHHGRDYRAIETHLVLQHGRLKAAPFTAQLPDGGHLNAQLGLDTSVTPPALSLVLHAPDLAAADLLRDAGQPQYLEGKLAIDADLHAAGATPHALADALDGSLAATMQGGSIDLRLLDHLLGPTLQKANLLPMLAGGGTTALRCFALRAVAHNGVAHVRPLLLDTAKLTLDGEGDVDLGRESLALRLRPHAQLAGAGLVVPIRVTGALTAPNVEPDVAGIAGAAGAGLGGGGGAPLAGALGNLLGGHAPAAAATSGGSAMSCASALAESRGAAASASAPAAAPASAAPAPRPAAPSPTTPSQPASPGTILRQLFH